MISKELIFMNKNFETQDEVFKYMAQMAVKSGILECPSCSEKEEENCKCCEEKFYEGLLAREEEGTTGVGEGFAIPHAKIEEVKKAAVLVTFLNKGIEWKSLDDEPVEIVIGLAIPKKEAGTTHIEMLTKIASNLMEDDFRENLKKVKTVDEAYNILKSVL